MACSFPISAWDHPQHRTDAARATLPELRLSTQVVRYQPREVAVLAAAAPVRRQQVVASQAADKSEAECPGSTAAALLRVLTAVSVRTLLLAASLTTAAMAVTPRLLEQRRAVALVKSALASVEKAALESAVGSVGTETAAATVVCLFGTGLALTLMAGPSLRWSSSERVFGCGMRHLVLQVVSVIENSWNRQRECLANASHPEKTTMLGRIPLLRKALSPCVMLS